MNNSDNKFDEIAGKKASKYPPPFSLRLTFEERAMLDRASAGMSLGAYIRDKVLGDDVSPRHTRGKFPVKDHAALGRVLGALGASRLSANLNQLAKVVNSGSLPVTPETEADYCAFIYRAAQSRTDLAASVAYTTGRRTGYL